MQNVPYIDITEWDKTVKHTIIVISTSNYSQAGEIDLVI